MYNKLLERIYSGFWGNAWWKKKVKKERAVIVSVPVAPLISPCFCLFPRVHAKYIAACLCSSPSGLCCSAHAPPVCASGCVSARREAGSTTRALIKPRRLRRALHPHTQQSKITIYTAVKLSSSDVHKRDRRRDESVGGEGKKKKKVQGWRESQTGDERWE